MLSAFIDMDKLTRSRQTLPDGQSLLRQDRKTLGSGIRTGTSEEDQTRGREANDGC
jgi:hypothetical protein